MTKSKAKPVSKKVDAKVATGSGRYKSFRLQKQIKRPAKVKMSNVYRLFMDSLDLVRSNWKLFGGVTLAYLVLSVVLTGVLSTSFNLNDLKAQMEANTVGSSGGVGGAVALFGAMLGTAGGASSQTGTAYQTMIVVIVSLAIIWTLRQVLAGKPVTVRDAFYKGMYPLIPFILVLLVIGIQLIPLALGGVIYGMAFNGGAAIGALEKSMWGTMVFLLMLLSVYMICASLFALYIVTLPNTRPMMALRSARELVRYRRWTVLRKLLFLPVALLLVGVVIMIPLIMYVAVVAQLVFLVLSMFALILIHAYVYTLYKELL